MANFTLTHAPLLQSSAQLYILPVSSDGIILDAVVNRCRTLFPDNYQIYHRYCREGRLPTGSCLVYQREKETAGLATSSNGDKPNYLANLATLDHPYHPLHKRWLNNALDDIHPKLFELIRYEGLRRIALLARPLITVDPHIVASTDAQKHILDWHQDIYPLIKQKLQDLPKVSMDIHVPHHIDI